MNKEQLKNYNTLLLMEIDGIQEVRRRDYNTLKKKYEAAERNLKNNPEKCGGEDHIKGYMSGLLDGMVLLDPDLKSYCCDLEEPEPNSDFDIGF